MDDDRRAIRAPQDFEQRFPRAERSATEVIRNLQRAGESVSGLIAQAVRPYGIPSATALMVLEILAAEPMTMTPSEVAERSLVGRATVSGVLNTLTRYGLVVRTPDTRDRRSIQLVITPEGRERLRQARAELHALESRWCRALTEADRQQLIALLAVVPADG